MADQRHEALKEEEPHGIDPAEAGPQKPAVMPGQGRVTDRFPGRLWATAFAAVGVLLLLYRES